MGPTSTLQQATDQPTKQRCTDADQQQRKPEARLIRVVHLHATHYFQHQQLPQTAVRHKSMMVMVLAVRHSTVARWSQQTRFVFAYRSLLLAQEQKPHRHHDHLSIRQRVPSVGQATLPGALRPAPPTRRPRNCRPTNPTAAPLWPLPPLEKAAPTPLRWLPLA